MSELTIKNINIIIEEVSHAGITLSHLRDELIDHICCQVEGDMQQGLTFEDAYKKTKEVVGNKQLKKIQEDTLFLIDKKYRLMKKTMKLIGLISMSMITVGALFKIQHWPGAGVLLIFGFLFLGTIFFPSALWVMKKESKLKGSLFIYLISIMGGILFIFGILFKIQHYPGAGILLTIGFSIIGLVLIPAILISKLRDEGAKNLHTAYIIGAISLIIYLAGDLFKIMHWPGAGPCLILGAIGLTTVFLPIYAMKVYKNAESVKAGFLFLCIGILFFNMFNLLLALNVSKDVLGYFVKPGKEIIKTTNILENKSNTLSEKILTDSMVSDTSLKANIKKIKSLSDATYSFIEGIKTDLISTVEGVDKDQAIAEAINPTLININKDGGVAPMNMLLRDNEDGKSSIASQIKMKIKTLKNSLLNYCSSDKNVENIIEKVLETKDPAKEQEQSISWEDYNFYHLTMISTFNKLCYLQRNVRIAEFETLESLESLRMADVQKSISKK
jgi:uncharacterized membrane protein (DUF106 family)